MMRNIFYVHLTPLDVLIHVEHPLRGVTWRVSVVYDCTRKAVVTEVGGRK